VADCFEIRATGAMDSGLKFVRKIPRDRVAVERASADQAANIAKLPDVVGQQLLQPICHPNDPCKD
jgi:hypothetical protein